MDSRSAPDFAADQVADRAALWRIYVRMLAAVVIGVALGVTLHVLWPAAQGPVAWIALVGGTLVWGIVQTVDLRLSAAQAVLLFEAGLACFALTGALIVFLGDIWLLIPWGIGVYAFRTPLDRAFRQRAVAAHSHQEQPSESAV